MCNLNPCEKNMRHCNPVKGLHWITCKGTPTLKKFAKGWVVICLAKRLCGSCTEPFENPDDAIKAWNDKKLKKIPKPIF